MGGRLLKQGQTPSSVRYNIPPYITSSSLMRTDEGVCPYFKALSGLQNSSLISSHEALLPLGEAGWGFWTRASVPTSMHHLLLKQMMVRINERLSLKQRDALLISKKRPSPLEKGVSLIQEYYQLHFTQTLFHILTILFTPLSMRRGAGGEALFQFVTTYISS